MPPADCRIFQFTGFGGLLLISEPASFPQEIFHVLLKINFFPWFLDLFLHVSGMLTAAELFLFMAEGTSLPQIWTPPKGNEPVGANGHVWAVGDIFANASGERLRFWGTNLSFKSNFPDKKDAEALAKRLRAFGFNVVRLRFADGRDPLEWRGTQQSVLFGRYAEDEILYGENCRQVVHIPGWYAADSRRNAP